MIFTTLVAFSALFVAGCAAFFSIKGLIVLFSGSALAIGIMASSLELGKLVAASFLHTHWSRINFLLKTYLCTAVLVLMCITSLGIFGFLTGAYQVHSTKVGTFSTQIATLTNEKDSVAAEIAEHSNRIKALTEVRATQEQRVATAGNYKAPRDQAYKAISEANEEIQKKEVEISQGRQRGAAIDKELEALKISLNTTTDIGSFKFIADALHTSIDTAVQYFILLLICVFDPLAVTLVLAWNNLVAYRKVLKAKEEDDFLAGLSRSVPIEVAATPVTPAVAEVTTSYSPKPVVVDMTPQVTPQVTSQVTPQVDRVIEFSLPPMQPETAAAVPVVIPAVVPVQSPIALKADFENDSRFLKLSEEQKNIERARRRVSIGTNDSVITI